MPHGQHPIKAQTPSYPFLPRWSTARPPKQGRSPHPAEQSPSLCPEPTPTVRTDSLR